MNEQGKDYEAFVAANKTGDWFNFKAGESYGREESLKEINEMKELENKLNKVIEIIKVWSGDDVLTPEQLESINWRDEKIKKLKSQLNIAKEVIKFYADQANWWFDEYDVKYSDIALQDIDECGFGGKKAREWLNDNK